MVVRDHVLLLPEDALQVCEVLLVVLVVGSGAVELDPTWLGLIVLCASIAVDDCGVPSHI